MCVGSSKPGGRMCQTRKRTRGVPPCLLPLVLVLVRFFLAASFFGGGLGGSPSFSRLLGPLLVVLLLSLALFFGCFALFGGGPGGNSCAPRLVLLAVPLCLLSPLFAAFFFAAASAFCFATSLACASFVALMRSATTCAALLASTGWKQPFSVV